MPNRWSALMPKTRVRALSFCSLAILVAMATNPARADDPRAGKEGPANRLAKETSPYLRLHAHNPIDWYPWGPEAFAKAKAENKPIFLSVGYSACYWCHVMERESFSNPEIARLLNARFVSIKVDREERPDVDQIYMTALQVFGNGGWPMSMFLTPEGLPFFGGTYFPPTDRDGNEGFPGLLKRVGDAWRDQRKEIERDATRLSDMVKRSLAGSALRGTMPLSRLLAQGGVDALSEQFDPDYGGFGFNPENPRRPKFPEPVNLVFLLDQHRRTASKAEKPKPPGEPAGPLEMVLETIDHMARGGIRDQLAGGYHRYATSRYWIVPHFEKMLYDNAQLATTHLLAFEATGDPRWRAEAEATFAFIERSMTSPEGAFYSSIDAETRGEEGEYYVWTREQVAEAIGDGPDADMFSQVYGLKRDPNFEKNRYVLLEPRSRADQAGSLKTTPEALEAKLGPLRAKLLAARDQRPAPRRDDKILTAWNGLMIAAYADGYRVLKVDRYRLAAEKGADFLLKNLRTSEGKLLRTYCDGRAKLPAYLEDYAFLAHGLLRLHAATGDSQRLQQARELTDKMVDGFLDKRGGGFFFTADDHESLIARSKDPVDNVLPSGNSVAIRNLVALGKLTGEKRYLDIAGQALNAFSATMLRSPASVPLMLVGLSEYLDARPGPDAPLAEDSVAKPLDSSKYVTATGKVVESKGQPISAGTEIQVAIDIKIADGWHIYANPTGIDEIPPTKLTLEAEAGSATMLDSVTYPEGVAKILASTSKAKVSLHEGTITLLAKVKLDPKLKPGPHALVFNLYCQACNDKSCMSPAKLSVKVPFEAGSPRAGRE